jgi:hypothetical protein
MGSPHCRFTAFESRLRAFIARESAAARLAPSVADASVVAAFNALALELFALQFEANLPYRRFCERRGVTPDRVDRWDQIPAVPTTAFRDLDLTCLPVAERTVVFQSSGTTSAQPSRHFHNAASLALYEASLRPWFDIHVLRDFQEPLPSRNDAVGMGSADRRPAVFGGPPNTPFPTLPHPVRSTGPQGERSRRTAGDDDRRAAGAPRSPFMIALTPPPSQAPHSSLVHMLNTVLRSFGSADSGFVGHVAPDGNWALDLPRAVSVLREAARAGRPIVLLGTAFNFVHVLDHLAGISARLALPPDSRVLETGGYKGRSRALPKRVLHSLITQWLGVPPSRIVCEYGMCELTSQAYEVGAADTAQEPSARCFLLPPWARARVVSAETGQPVGGGETGLLQIVDLANVRSVLAVQTQDLAVRRDPGFELLGRAPSVEPRGCSLLSADLLAPARP